MAYARLFKSRIDLAKYAVSLVGTIHCAAEVGVYRGDFSAVLLDLCKPDRLFLIDRDVSRIYESIVKSPAVAVLAGDSASIIRGLDDHSIDYLYIDADHSYHGVVRDIAAAERKIKPGGVIQFNDYCTYSPPERIRYGVLDAVNEYLERSAAYVVGLSLERSGYHDIAIRC
jgi:predicted O-methyltransferase YrrM